MSFWLEIVTVLAFLFGSARIFHWQKKQVISQPLFYLLIWTAGILTTYTFLVELREGTFYILGPVLFFGVFAASYFMDKRKLINGFLFNLFLMSLGIYFIEVLFQAESIFLGGILAVAGILLLLVLMFGIYIVIGFLYWNGLTVLKKESFSLANLLTLLLGIGLTVYFLFQTFVLSHLPTWLGTLFAALPLLMMYFLGVFLNFLTVSILYQFNRPTFDQDYIIVLGAGLLKGEKVSPLLAGRINKAIQFYHAQLEKTSHPIKILLSGGQGSDEKISEAEAMKDYAIDQGIPEEDLLIENQSKTTLQNMHFSKEVMEARQPQPFKAIFTSNNYHIFRAGMYAKAAQLKADGLGARTAGYFLPNAFLREFIAIIALKKKRHMAVCLLILLGTAFLAFASFFVLEP